MSWKLAVDRSRTKHVMEPPLHEDFHCTKKAERYSMLLCMPCSNDGRGEGGVQIGYE